MRQSMILTMLSTSVMTLGMWTSGAQAVSPIHSPMVGDGAVYSVTSTGVSRVDYGLVAAGMSKAVGQDRPVAQGTTQIQTIRYDLSAKLHTRVLASDASGVLVAARLQDVSLIVDGSMDARRDLLATPFTLRYNRSGHMVSFQFTDRFPQDLRTVIQRLVEPMQGVAPPAGGAAAWSANERDSDTSFTARYQSSAVNPANGLTTWTKTKTEVRPQSADLAAIPLPGAPSARVNRSQTTLTFDAIRGDLASVRSGESVTTRMGSAFFSDYDTTYQAVRVQAPLAPLARTVAEAEALRHDPAFARARLYDVDAHTRRAVEGVRLTDMMASFRSKAPTGVALAAHQLGSWLRLNPAASLEIARQINDIDPKTERSAFGFGWAALASAGHPEAQKALVAVATQPGWKALSAHKALVAMMNLDSPEPATAKQVWALRSSIAERGNSQRRLSVATNVYGILGDVQKGNPALTDQVVANLAGLLKQPDSQSRVLALDALSNVGDLNRVAPLAAQHLTSTDLRVRNAAFGTFRRMTGDVAFQKFAAAFAAEMEPEMRREAALVAYQMEPGPARNAWATKLVTSEADPKVKSELVQILGRGMKRFPENAQILQDLLSTTHERTVRRDIYAYVSPVTKGGTR